jgi:hypothetical protein
MAEQKPESEDKAVSLDAFQETAFKNFLKIVYEQELKDFAVIGDVAVNIYDKKNQRPTNTLDVVITYDVDEIIEQQLVEMRYLVKATQKKHFKFYTKGEDNIIYTRPYEKSLFDQFFQNKKELSFPIKIEDETITETIYIPEIPQLIKTKIDAVEDMNRGDKDIIDINRLFKVGIKEQKILTKQDIIDIIKYFKEKENQLKIHNRRGRNLLIKTFRKITKLMDMN